MRKYKNFKITAYMSLHPVEVALGMKMEKEKLKIIMQKK